MASWPRGSWKCYGIKKRRKNCGTKERKNPSKEERKRGRKKAKEEENRRKEKGRVARLVEGRIYLHGRKLRFRRRARVILRRCSPRGLLVRRRLG